MERSTVSKKSSLFLLFFIPLFWQTDGRPIGENKRNNNIDIAIFGQITGI